jgi:hypothetical protein
MRRLAAVALAVCVAGCGLLRPRPALPPGTTAEGLLATLDARRAAVRSMRARVHIRSGLVEMWAREAVLVERPRAVRVDVLSPFGLAVALGTDGERLWVYPPREGLRYEGAATPENVTRFLGAAVSVGDLVDMLLGCPPKRTPTGPVAFVPLPDGRGRVVVPFAGGEQRLDFAGRPPQVERADEVRAGRLELRIDFSDYRDGFPYVMDLRRADGPAASLRYVALETNVAVDPAVFAPPPATRVLPIDGLAIER